MRWLLVLYIMFSACTAPKQLQHGGSGMIFPPAVGSFQRAEVRKYDPAGFNLSVAYNLLRLGPAVALTVYNYPAVSQAKEPVKACAAAALTPFLAQIKNDIVKVHQGAVPIVEEEVAGPNAAISCPGLHSVMRYVASISYGPQTFLTETYLFVWGPWFIKYRFTYLEEWKTTVSKEIDEFMRLLAWPTKQ